MFGAFLDSTFDRLGEAAMLTAIGLVFMRDGNEVALVATFAAVIGSFLVSLHAREGRGARPPRRRRLRLARRARRPHLGRARSSRPWGWLQWPIYVLAAMAWLTVVQRMLFVRAAARAAVARDVCRADA